MNRLLRAGEIVCRFHKGERGLICRRPSDRGAWVAPEQGTTPEAGVEYIVRIEKEARSGRLRFGQIVCPLAERTNALREWLAPKLEEALNDERRLEATWHYDTCQVLKIIIEGEYFAFEVTERPGEGCRRNWLRGPAWLPLLRLTDAARAALAEAKAAYELQEELKRRARWAREQERRATAAAERAQKVAADATEVAAFVAAYPQFAGRVETLAEAQDAAVNDGLARQGRLVNRRPYGRGGVLVTHEYLLPVGEEEWVFNHTVDWEDGD